MRESCAYNLYCAVPRARGKRVFGDGAPGHGKGLTLVLVKVHDGEVGDVCVVQLDGAIAAGHQQLVLVELRPREIILGVVCVESFLGDDQLRLSFLWD